MITISEETIESTQPRGLARLDAAAWVELESIILATISNGDRTTPRGSHGVHMWSKNWKLYAADDAIADDSRRRFCAVIKAAIIAKAAPKAVTK